MQAMRKKREDERIQRLEDEELEQVWSGKKTVMRLPMKSA
jgi:hypothetical protein